MPVTCTAIRRSMTCLLMFLIMVVAPVTPILAAPAGLPGNFIDLLMSRSSFFGNPEVLILDMEVTLGVVAGVTGVNVTIGDGTVLPMTDDGDGVWFLDLNPSSLAELISFSNGIWTVEIVGSTPSASTFTVSTASLVEADLFPTPTGLSPAHDDIDVPADAAFSWNDPTGPATPDGISVCVFNTVDFTDICDDSIFGSMLVTDSTWTPLGLLTPGLTEFEVFYVDIDATRITSIAPTSGSIVWSDHPFAPLGYPASAPLLLIGSETIVSFTVAPPPTGSINLVMFRTDNPLNPANFIMDMDVELSDTSGLTGVDVTVGDGTVLPMTDDGDGVWFLNHNFSTLADVITKSNGTWTIDIFGTSPSTSTFSVNSAGLLNSDFFASPTGLFPANGAVDVAADVIMSWDDPTGPATPDGIGVCSFNTVDFTDICDDSIFGSMLVTDTTWTPPAPLTPGLTEFEVVYVDVDDARVGPLSVTSGLIVWTDHPFTPLGYPASTPLHFLGSETIITFTVLNACPADTDSSGSVNVTDLLSLLAGWGPNPGHIADINGDGTINVTDLLALLAAWGPCL